MCKECDKISSDLNALQLTVNELRNDLNQISNSALLIGKHPILAISDYSDVAEFDASTGWADFEGKWNGWALCNGVLYTNPTDSTEKVQSPDLTDKIQVGSTDKTVGDISGSLVPTGATGKQLTKIVYVIKVYDASQS